LGASHSFSSLNIIFTYLLSFAKSLTSHTLSLISFSLFILSSPELIDCEGKKEEKIKFNKGKEMVMRER